MKAKKTSRAPKGRPGKAGEPKTPADYLAKLCNDMQAALETLRKTIRAAAPNAEECISYQLPAFRFKGKLLVAYGAAAKHCAFYPGSVLEERKDKLKNYDTSKGTIGFPADKPLPANLVRKLVKLRIDKIRG
jgi:uncharacterized protein YdhG (YjbR/CyaY superfamily)